MGSLRFNRAQDLVDDYDQFDDLDERFERAGKRREKRIQQAFSAPGPSSKQRNRKLRRGEQDKPFKCRRCKAFIGSPLTGGRHRNHCPNCLYSLHVDLKTPGDRASDCETLMEPIATVTRPNGEQAIQHRCLSCGILRNNRVAADDNPLLVMRLPLAESEITATAESVSTPEEVA